MTSFRRAGLLGAVQGITEALPVSSSAHLSLVPWLLGWEPEAERTAFAAGLHAGSCVGVAWALRHELAALPRTPAGRRTALRLGATSVPAAVGGALGADWVETRLGAPAQVAALLAGAGLVLLAADSCPQDGPGVTSGASAAAAVAQVVALAPGVSRLAVTLATLRLFRVERSAALRESLLMSLPVTAGAAAHSLLRSRRALPTADLALAAPVAAVAAHWATTRQLRAPRGQSATAAYRLVLAAVVVAVAARRARTPSRPRHGPVPDSPR